MFKHARLFTAIAAAAVAVTAVPATADAQTRNYVYPTASVRLWRAAVHEPGTLSMTVTVSTCVTAVSARADSEASMFFGVGDAVTLKKPGKSVTLSFTFTSKDPGGRYVPADMLGRLCGSAPGKWTEIDPAHVAFPAFNVDKGK